MAYLMSSRVHDEPLRLEPIREDEEAHIPISNPKHHHGIPASFGDDPLAQQQLIDISLVDEDEKEDDTPPALSYLEIKNLFLTVLSWACVICNIQLAIATSPMITLSIGGSMEIAAVPQGVFYISAGFASVVLTTWIFDAPYYQRRGGFLIGIALGLLGTSLAGMAIALVQSPALFIVANVFLGMSMGVGFHLRFAAVEVVPPHWASRAVSLVVSGGCISSFLGPESALATRDLFGTTPDRQYLGVIMMMGIFNLLNLVFVMFIQFPPPPPSTVSSKNIKASSSSNRTTTTNVWPEAWSILQTRAFLTPMAAMTLSWIIMSAPMTLLRVAMHQLGYTDRQSLLGIELHFLGMYAPGFVVGILMQRFGPRRMTASSILLFGAGIATLQRVHNQNNDDTAVWFVGMILMGIAWNVGFNGATVWLTGSYQSAPHLKSSIQSANDFVMFTCTGAFVASTSFLYEAGGSYLPGWQTVHWIVLGVLAVPFCSLLLMDVLLDQRQHKVAVVATTTTMEP